MKQIEKFKYFDRQNVTEENIQLPYQWNRCQIVICSRSIEALIHLCLEKNEIFNQNWDQCQIMQSLLVQIFSEVTKEKTEDEECF